MRNTPCWLDIYASSSCKEFWKCSKSAECVMERQEQLFRNLLPHGESNKKVSNTTDKKTS